MIDQAAPTVQWTAPVLDGQRYDLREGEQVLLEIEVSDNGTIGEVKFLLWDAVNELYVTLASLDQPPYSIMINASALQPGWNQIFGFASDLAGNQSNYPYIWLYKLTDGVMDHSIYLPLVGR